MGSSFPTSIDATPTDVTCGSVVTSAAWNTYLDGIYQACSAVGIDSSTDTVSLDYKIKSTSSFNPGHRHNIVYASDGTTVCLSGGANAGNIAISGVAYTLPSAQGASGSLLADYGSGSLGWQQNLVIIAKSQTETVNNSNTLQDDDHLFFNVTQGEMWVGKMYLKIGTSTTADFKYSLSGTAAQTIKWVDHLREAYCCTGVTNTPLVEYTNEDSVAKAGAGVLTYQLMIVSFLAYFSSASGKVQLRWAQNTADASNTTVGYGSCIIMHRLYPL